MSGTAWLVMGALFFVWVSASLVLGMFFGRLMGPRAVARSNGLQRVLLWLHHGLALAPALWIVAAVALVARAVLTVGEWPRAGEYGFLTGSTPPNISPMSFGAHHEAALALFAATWVSLVVFPSLHVAANRLLGARAPLWFAGWLVTWLAGLLLSIYEGPYGIAEWIL